MALAGRWASRRATPRVVFVETGRKDILEEIKKVRD
nr:MAG TPA: hypothetical protein [Caudoviricetes sp.]